MEERIKSLASQEDHLFEKRTPVLSLWQSIADQFYPERVFLYDPTVGEEFNDHLTTSYPILARRDLGNSLSAMLRPTDKDWLSITTSREDRVDNSGKRWLEDKTAVQMRAMYDKNSGFVKSTKIGDHDYAAFGQCVLSCELSRERDRLLYRNWELKDVAWSEDYRGQIDTIFRRWKPTYKTLAQNFPKGLLDKKAIEKLDKHPYENATIVHAVVPSETYHKPSKGTPGSVATSKGGTKWATPFVSIYYDKENDHIIEETGVYTTIYIIPRWQTVSGTQYAHSPATIVALPDARLIQAMSLTLLEAGEIATHPPTVIKDDVFRDDLNFYAGGVTVADLGDSRIQDVMQTMTHDKSGIPFGIDMNQEIKVMISQAFFLNQLRMPVINKEATAFEVAQITQEYIRQALPIIEPTEAEYNGQLAEITFDTLMRGGAFGSLDDLPDSLKGQEIEFRFSSPLNDVEDSAKAQHFLEAKILLGEAAALDTGVMAMVDVDIAIRDVLESTVPAEWIRSEKDAEVINTAIKQKQQIETTMDQIGQAGAVAEQVGKGNAALKDE